jgi:hypothetical protein
MRNPPSPAAAQSATRAADATVALAPLGELRPALVDRTLGMLNASALCSTLKALPLLTRGLGPGLPPAPAPVIVGAVLLALHPDPMAVMKEAPVDVTAAAGWEADENMEGGEAEPAQVVPPRRGTPTLVPQLASPGSPCAAAAPTLLLRSAMKEREINRTPPKSALKKRPAPGAADAAPMGGMGSPSAIMGLARSALFGSAAVVGSALGFSAGLPRPLPTPVARFMASRRVSYGVSGVALIPAVGDNRYSLVDAHSPDAVQGDGGARMVPRPPTPMEVDDEVVEAETVEPAPTVPTLVFSPPPAAPPMQPPSGSRSGFSASDLARKRRSYGSSMPAGKTLPAAQAAAEAAASSAAAAAAACADGVDEDGDESMMSTGGVAAFSARATPVAAPAGHVLFDSADGAVKIVLRRASDSARKGSAARSAHTDEEAQKSEAEGGAEYEGDEEEWAYEGEEEGADEVGTGVIACTGLRSRHLFFTSPTLADGASAASASHPSFDHLYGLDAEDETADEAEVEAVAAAVAPPKPSGLSMMDAIRSRRKSYGAKEAVGAGGSARPAPARPASVPTPAAAPARVLMPTSVFSAIASKRKSVGAVSAVAGSVVVAAAVPTPAPAGPRVVLPASVLNAIAARRKSGGAALAASARSAEVEEPVAAAAPRGLPTPLKRLIQARRKSGAAAPAPAVEAEEVEEEEPVAAAAPRGLPTPLKRLIQARRKSGAAAPAPAVEAEEEEEEEEEEEPVAAAAPPTLPTPVVAVPSACGSPVEEEQDLYAEEDSRYRRGNRSAIYNNSVNKNKRLSTVMEGGECCGAHAPASPLELTSAPPLPSHTQRTTKTRRPAARSWQSWMTRRPSLP